MKLKVMKLHPNAIIPTRKNPTDAGLDLYALEDYSIGHHGYCICHTGISIEVPEGYFFLIKPKGRNNHLIGSGVVDAHYEPGEFLVKIVNYSNNYIDIEYGDAIAQIILIPILTPELEEVEDIEAVSERSATGGIVEQTSNITPFLDYKGIAYSREDTLNDFTITGMEKLTDDGWKLMLDEKPPYCDSPTWFDVILWNGIKDRVCRWWDHCYQSLYNDADIYVWRLK
jgi:dUTP pyrophosphatase